MGGEVPRRKDYAFYGEGMSEGAGRATVLPLRRLLRRLQRPWFLRQEEILEELRQDIDAQAAQFAQVAQVQQLVAELRTLVEQQEARSWDQAAISRRLAAIEDALAQRPSELGPRPPLGEGHDRFGQGAVEPGGLED